MLFFLVFFFHFLYTEYIINKKGALHMIKTLFELCFLFFLYSFTGGILEVIQAAFNQKRFVNRGFLTVSVL